MKPILKLESITVDRQGRTILCVDEWSLEAGQNWVLFGPNGAGKTTLLNLLTGYLWPSTGTVDVLGERLGEVDLSQLRRQIAIVSDPLRRMMHGELNGLSVLVTGARAHLNLFGPPSREEFNLAQETAEITSTTGLLNRPFEVMSTGERQRLMIARALMVRPRILILDEPAAGLDMSAREFVLQTVDHITKTKIPPVIVLTTHHVEEITPIFSHALLLKNGGVFGRGPTTKMFTSANISDLFDLPVRVTRRHGRFQSTILRGAETP